jgi:hypothetical protein
MRLSRSSRSISKSSGLLSSVDPETSSIIAPSGKISKALMALGLVAFWYLFALVVTLWLKTDLFLIRQLCRKSRRRTIVQFASTEIDSLHSDRLRFHASTGVALHINSKGLDRLAEPRHTDTRSVYIRTKRLKYAFLLRMNDRTSTEETSSVRSLQP